MSFQVALDTILEQIKYFLYVNIMIITQYVEDSPMPEQRVARLTVLIDPRKKAVFEALCRREDMTPSQVVRRMIREFIEARTGSPWDPDRIAPLSGETLPPSVKGPGSP